MSPQVEAGPPASTPPQLFLAFLTPPDSVLVQK